jgi:hypothetical protein
MIPEVNKKLLVAYIAKTGAQRFSEICEGMYRASPSVHVTPYLLKVLCKEQRIEKIGFDSYRAAPLH